MASQKYATPGDEHENLPNLLGLVNPIEIEQAEAEGFLHATQILLNELTETTRFDLEYIQRIHQLALGKLYGFAGRWRQVNMRKGGFNFPPAMFIDRNKQAFEQEFLALELWESILQSPTNESLANYLGRQHAELLFIHPSRDGNGRSARLLADLMLMQARGEFLDFDSLRHVNNVYDQEYVTAVHAAGREEYEPMIQLFSERFLPGD